MLIVVGRVAVAPGGSGAGELMVWMQTESLKEPGCLARCQIYSWFEPSVCLGLRYPSAVTRLNGRARNDSHLTRRVVVTRPVSLSSEVSSQKR